MNEEADVNTVDNGFTQSVTQAESRALYRPQTDLCGLPLQHSPFSAAALSISQVLVTPGWKETAFRQDGHKLEMSLTLPPLFLTLEDTAVLSAPPAGWDCPSSPLSLSCSSGLQKVASTPSSCFLPLSLSALQTKTSLCPLSLILTPLVPLDPFFPSFSCAKTTRGSCTHILCRVLTVCQASYSLCFACLISFNAHGNTLQKSHYFPR